MSFINWLRWFRGIAVFRVEGENRERFFNILRKNQIPLFHARQENDGFFTETFCREYHRIRPFVRKTHVKVQVVQRIGFPFFMKKYASRVGMAAGILLFLGMVFLSGEFVWEIRISGNHAVSDEAVISTLEQLGLSRGKWKPSLDAGQIAMKLRHSYEEIGFAAVNLIGSVAQVEISERTESEEMPETTEPCNIVAARSGQIVIMEVYDGQEVVNRGDVVKQGQLLVSGVVTGSTGKKMLRHSKARIMAEYPDDYEVSVPMECQAKVQSAPVQNYRYLNLGRFRLPLFWKKDFVETGFERSFVRPVKLWGVRLPFDMTVEQVIPAKIKTVKLSRKKALDLAVLELEKWEQQTPFRQKVSRKLTTHMEKGQLVVQADYIFRENIARQEKIGFNGEKDF